MKIQGLQEYNAVTNFGNRFILSDKALNKLSKTTKLSREELGLPLNDAIELMQKRGALQKTKGLEKWVMNSYQRIGKKLGLLK